MSTAFHRSRFTWLGYIALAYFAYIQLSLGPVMPLLREELNLSYTVGALHATALAFGSVIVGLVGDRIANRLGNRITFWGSGSGLAVGTLLFLIAPTVALTLPAILLMGLCGSMLLTIDQALLSDEHGPHRSVALLEANLAAVVVASLAPLLIGGFAASGLGWRSALLIPVGAWVTMGVLGARTPLPETPLPVSEVGSTALPVRFWLYWLALFFGIAVEWCLALWSADFLVTAAGVAAATAALLLSVFIGAGILSRLVISRLVSRYHPNTLLLGAQALILVGFPLLWLGGSSPVRILGLAIAGFGAYALFPLGLAGGMESVPERARQASARLSLAGGLAILLNPQLLGILADFVGLEQAFGVVPIYVGLGMSVALLARWQKEPLPS